VDRDEIVRVLRAFEAAGLEYVLIGATAMGFHGLVRATEDIDLFIRATPENVERLPRRCVRPMPATPKSTESWPKTCSGSTRPFGTIRQTPISSST